MKIISSLCQVYALRILNFKDPKWKRKVLAFLFLALLFGSYLVGYCYFAAKILVGVGMLNLLPPAIFTIASVLALMTSIYHVDGALINAHDDVILGSLPITKKQLVISRVLPMYLENLLIILAIFIPCVAIMNLFEPLSLGFVLRLTILLPWAPMFPLGLGLLIGLMIAYISEHFKHSKLMSILLTFAFIFILYYYIFQMENIGDVSTLFELVSQILTSIYPLSNLFVNFLIDVKIVDLVLYVAIQLFALVSFIMFLTKYQHSKKQAKQDKQVEITKIKQSSILWALYRKELSRYFSSVPYVTNTAITYVLLLGGCIYLQFQDLDSLLVLMDIPELKEVFLSILPMMIGLMVGIGTTTSCSIALEGKSLWQLKTLPIKAQTVFLAKIMLNLTLSIPSVLLIAFLLMNALKFDVVTLGLMIGMPLLYATLFSQVGLIGNLFFPHLNWTSEVKAIKQGFATLFVMITALTLGMLPIALLQTDLESATIIGTLVIVLIVGNIGCIIYLKQFAPKKFYRL